MKLTTLLRMSVGVIAGLLSLSSTLWSEVRTLTDKQGRSIKADVIAVTGDQVKIKREYGQTFNLPLSSLSDSDQQALKAWAAANPPKLGADEVLLQFSRGKFGTEKEMQSEGAVTAYKDQWGYSLTLTNKSKQVLSDIRADYILFVKQDAVPGSKEKDPGLRRVKSSTKPESIPLHESMTFRTDTVVSYRYVLQPGWVWGGAGGSSKPIRDTLYGMWLRVYVGDQLVIEKITPEDLAKTEKW